MRNGSRARADLPLDTDAPALAATVERGQVRYWIVVTLCRILGHPERRTRQQGGLVRIACPCGYIDIYERVR